MRTCCWSQISAQVLWFRTHGLGVTWQAGKNPDHMQGNESVLKHNLKGGFEPQKSKITKVQSKTRTNMRTTILPQLCKCYHEDGPSLSSPWIAAGLHIRWLTLWARISLKVKIPYLRLKYLCSMWRIPQ